MIENPWNEKELEADPELIVVGKDGSEEVEESEIFPVCVVTRAMALRERDDDAVEEGTVETSLDSAGCEGDEVGENVNLTQLFRDVQNVEENEGVGDLQNVDDGFEGVNENKTEYKVSKIFL